jgi:hypothetical protein
MISVFTLSHRYLTGSNLDCFQNLPARFLADCSPRPIPAQEWRVQPPMFTAAIPVDAVIANRSEGLPPKWFMMARSRTDFPVPWKRRYSQASKGQGRVLPADPVKNTLWPAFTCPKMCSCCWDSLILFVHGVVELGAGSGSACSSSIACASPCNTEEMLPWIALAGWPVNGWIILQGQQSALSSHSSAKCRDTKDLNSALGNLETWSPQWTGM